MNILHIGHGEISYLKRVTNYLGVNSNQLKFHNETEILSQAQIYSSEVLGKIVRVNITPHKNKKLFPLLR